MRATPLILLLLIVCLPMGLLVWLGNRMASDEQTVIRQRFSSLLTNQLRDIDQIVAGHFATLQSRLRIISRLDSVTPAEIRSRLRSAPQVRQFLVYSPEGEVLHPNPDAALNSGEQKFFLQAADLISDRDIFYAAGGQRRAVWSTAAKSANPTRRGTSEPADRIPPEAPPEKSAAAAQRPASEEDTTAGSAAVPSPTEGWHIWFWGRGVHLFYWQRLESGHIVCLLVERSRWMADLIATLPQTVSPQIAVSETSSPDSDTLSNLVPGDSSSHQGDPPRAGELTASRVRLLDSAGHPVYQWGRYQPSQTDLEFPFAEVPVSEPLTSWRLQAFVPDELVQGASRSARFSMNASLAAAAVAVCLLMAFFWREYRRELREASQRVSFVNQVSHELRTPLTNIRMYADLLESDLNTINENDASRPRGRLRVIAEESQRLSRLIGNVLTMARQQRKTLTLKHQPAIIDDIIRDVLRQFEPALNRCHIKVIFKSAAPDTVSVDVDALEQILVNLFSNVEKYAASGKLLKLSTTQADDLTTITVSDAGPGIPARQRNAIFRPFYRSSDRLEDAAGTGIGLSIALELARLHSGNIRLIETDSGACFEVTLNTISLNTISLPEEMTHQQPDTPTTD